MVMSTVNFMHPTYSEAHKAVSSSSVPSMMAKEKPPAVPPASRQPDVSSTRWSEQMTVLIGALEQMVEELSARLQERAGQLPLQKENIKSTRHDDKQVNRVSERNAARIDKTVDSPNVDASAFIRGTPATVGNKPNDFVADFYQGDTGNCGMIACIKTAMLRFGHTPHGVFKKVQQTDTGFHIVMRDGYRLDITYSELEQAQKGSDFRANKPSDELVNAIFFYAVGAKRVLLKERPGLTGGTFAGAMAYLNDGAVLSEGMRHLGLMHYAVPASIQELVNGAPGMIGSFGHINAVSDGRLDDYGRSVPLRNSPWADDELKGIKLI